MIAVHSIAKISRQIFELLRPLVYALSEILVSDSLLSMFLRRCMDKTVHAAQRRDYRHSTSSRRRDKRKSLLSIACVDREDKQTR